MISTLIYVGLLTVFYVALILAIAYIAKNGHSKIAEFTLILGLYVLPVVAMIAAERF